MNDKKACLISKTHFTFFTVAISEEYEEEDDEEELDQVGQDRGKSEEEDIEDICRAVMCPRTEYCYVLRPGVAQCRKKAKQSKDQREREEDDLEDDSEESGSSEEDDESVETPKELRANQAPIKPTMPTTKATTSWGPIQYYNHSRIVQCPSCPIGRGHLLCGSNNITYSSMCRLEFHNCIHNSNVKFSCFGYCPCMKVYEKVMLPPPTSKGMIEKMADFIIKHHDMRQNRNKAYNGGQIKIEHIDKVEQTSIQLHDKNKQYNQVLDKEDLAKMYYQVDGITPKDNGLRKIKMQIGPIKIKPKITNTSISARSKIAAESCGPEQLRSMGLRLLDWFAVVMGEEMKLAKKAAAARDKNNSTISFKKRVTTLSNLSPDKLLPNCERAVSFMFHHFDVDTDYRLSFKELYYLEHDEGERCLEPYLLSCDEDANGYLTAYEWCSCFNLRSMLITQI